MEDCIIVQDVSKKFGTQIVLDQVSVSFEKGKIHGIIGRNGSGKTVLMKCICGIMHPSSGLIKVNGKNIGKEVDIAENVGIIIETPGFLPNYTGYKNLKMLMGINRLVNKAKITEVMRTVGLEPQEKKKVGKYSLGMRQRLGIAQAMMDDPQILILDEPMNGLDKDGVIEMRRLFLDLKAQGNTILLASHNKEDIHVLCDTVHEMDKGKITKIY